MVKRNNAGKYQSIEKILYLADKNEKGLNISVNERLDTDLSVRVSALVKANCLVNTDGDSENNYFSITKKGKVKLLKLQIEARKKLGKPVDLHEFELEELTELV